MALNLDDIRTLFERHGAMAYSGEPVTQLQHALQSGAFAEEAGADDALISAAFLHDLGHLLNLQGETPSERGIDDRHQHFALPFLRPVLPDSVLEPIRLHVDAKRYLCAVDPGYRGKLSADSVRSLGLQGGVFDDDQVRAFIAKPFAEAAVILRRWDDAAKNASKRTPDLEHFLSVVERVMCEKAGLDPARASRM